MATPERHLSPVLVLAPSGRDAAVATALLREVDVTAVVCGDIHDLATRLEDTVCCAVVTEEALALADLRSVSEWVALQPAWSDLAFIVLTRRGGSIERNPKVARLMAALGNVTFIERPFHPTTFASVIGTAVRGRHRQFEARSRIQQLHEGEARLYTALTAGQLGSWELDLRTQTLTTSATCRANFGRAEDASFTYQDLQASVDPRDRERMQRAVKASIESGADYAIECRNVWPDGSTHWVDIRARIVHDAAGSADRLVGVSSDITVRKMAEGELRRVNESLEAKVQERTADLQDAHRAVLDEIRQRERTEELLRQIQKLEMVGQLSGGIAHDFNNLLMAIMANLELARKEVPPHARLAELLDGALRGAQRGATLTQRLLAFARQQDLKVEPVRMSELVHGMVDLLERSIGSAIELHIESDPVVPSTLADVNQVELAILNLVVNSRDAMPDGGKLTIRIDTVHSSGSGELTAGDYVRLTVSDTGCGMDAATLAKATEPFFTTKEIGKGTGLGLSMIHGLAGQLHGALRIESAVGAGTQASLWLPVNPGEDAISADDPPDQVAAAYAGTDVHGVILLVDDDPLIATSTHYLLEDLGLDVVETHSGAAALDILRNGEPIDLLLTDYSMPRMTGIELAEAARLLRPGLPVILATGYAELPDGTGAGIPRLRKPYRQADLIAELGKALSSRYLE